ncbi:MAG: hypothetical protein HYS13_01280 [Planctomycetia bacterium]|nr:hypothetical protein [Planctomycetia bacterium]
MPNLDTDTLAALIERRHRCLVQLCELGELQAAAIGRDDMSELLAVLDQKQRRWRQWREIEDLLGPFRGQAPESRAWRDPQKRETSRRLQEDCEKLLEQIARLEEKCDADLRARRTELAGVLREMHSAALVRAAYSAPAPIVGGQLDLTSQT